MPIFPLRTKLRAPRNVWRAHFSVGGRARAWDANIQRFLCGTNDNWSQNEGKLPKWPLWLEKTLFWRLHPGRLTWNLKITYLKRKIIFQTSIIMFHVNLRGCIFFCHPKKFGRQTHRLQDVSFMCFCILSVPLFDGLVEPWWDLAETNCFPFLFSCLLMIFQTSWSQMFLRRLPLKFGSNCSTKWQLRLKHETLTS